MSFWPRRRPVRYRVVLGDICRRQVDAVVNAADRSLLGGTGVDGALRAAAGPGLSAACRALGGLGDKPKATPGFDLPARFVIHAAAPVHVHGMRRSDLASTYRDCVELAGEMRLASLAFPLLGAGVFGWDPEDSAIAAKEGIRRAARRARSLGEIVMVAFSPRDAAVLSEVFGVPCEETDEARVYNAGTV